MKRLMVEHVSPEHLEQVNSEVGAAAAARQAAGRIFRLDDEELIIDPLGEGGAKGSSQSAVSVGFRNIKFAYPERPDAQVKKNMRKMMMNVDQKRVYAWMHPYTIYILNEILRVMAHVKITKSVFTYL